MKAKLIFLVGLLSIISCESILKEKITGKIGVEEVLNDTTFSAMGAYFSPNVKNEIILSWTEEIDTSFTNILKYKIFDTKTKSFGETKEVKSSIGIQSHEESMAKIAKTSNGIMYAVFRYKTPTPKNRFAGSVFYSISSDDGTTWSEKKKLVTAETSQSQSFYDIALLPNGELGMCWLDNRKLIKNKGGSTLYFAHSYGNEGFVNEKPIAGSTCQCCRTDMFISGKNQINVAYRNIMNDSIRDMFVTKSLDNGKSFSKPVRMGKDDWKIFGCPHTGPSLAYNGVDLAVAWYTGAESGRGLFFKNLNDEIGFLKNKNLISPTGLHPQMTALNNGNYYLVYEDFYTENNQTYSDIILNTISADGEQNKISITKKHTFNDHAVISNVDNNYLLLAWVNKVEGKSKIVYKLINNE